MAAWQGGPCPECGEDMPPLMVRCRECRAMLNDDLAVNEVVAPEFVPMQELETHREVTCRGFYIQCPQCARELKLNRRFLKKNVMCKHCQQMFRFDPADDDKQLIGLYVDCPKCEHRLRLAKKYAGIKVACKKCDEQLTIQA